MGVPQTCTISFTAVILKPVGLCFYLQTGFDRIVKSRGYCHFLSHRDASKSLKMKNISSAWNIVKLIGGVNFG